MAQTEVGIRLTLSGAQQVEAGLQSAAGSMDRVAISAKQTAAALRNVPAQMTDIVVSLASGQAPLTVLLQQGGQLKDMFGGVGAATRALGGYVVGLINPFNVLAATAGAVAVAYYQGSKEADAFRLALITTGNAAGTSADQMAAMAQSMRDTGMTTGKAAEIMAAFAATGQVASYQMKQFTSVAADMEKYVGQSLDATVKNFSELGKKPAEAAKKLTEEQHYLSAAIYEQIKALEKEGETLQAGQLAQSSYAEAMQKRADKVRESLGFLERSWASVGSWAKKAWDYMLDIDRPDSLEQKLAKAREQFDASFDPEEIAVGRAQISMIQEAILRRNRASSRERVNQRGQDDAIKALDEVAKIQEKGWSKQTQLNKALSDYRDNLDSIRAANPNSALLDPKKIAEGEKALREQYKETASAAENQITSIKARIIAERMNLDILKERGTAAQDLNDGEKLSIQIQQELKGKLDAKTRAQKEAALAQANILAGVLKEEEAVKALAKWNDELSKRRVKEYEESVKADEKALEARKKLIEGVQQHVKKLDDEEEAITVAARNHLSLAAAVEQVGLARAQEAQDKALAAGADAATLLALQDEIEARKLLVYLINSKDARDASKKAAEDAAKEWKAASEKIGDSITDALMRGFESGKDFVKTLVDTIKNSFKTMVLKPIVRAVIQPISGALAGTMGITQAAQAGQAAQAASSGGNALSLAGAAQSAYSALSTGISSSIEAGFTRLMSSSFGESLGLAQPVGYTTGSGVQYGLSETGASVSSALGMAGNALGGYAISKGLSGGYQVGSGTIVDAITLAASAYFGPIAGVAAAAFNRAFGRKLTDTGVQGTFGGAEGFTGQNYQFYQGGWLRSDKTKLGAMDSALESGLATQFKTLQVSMGLMADTLGLSTDAVRDFTADVKLSFQGLTNEQIQTKLQEEFAKIGDSMASATLATTEYTRTGETATQTLQRLSGSLTTVNGAFDVLGLTLYEASVRGGDMASQLIDLMGGMEKFQATTASYYQAYYTEAERNTVATRQMAESLSALGLAMPDTREAFRALVEAQDLTTASGRAAYAALLGLAPAFASITKSTGDLRQSLDGLIVSVAQAGRSVLDSEAALADVEYQKKLKAAQTLQSTYDQQYDTQKAAADQARENAKAMADLGKSLRDYVMGQVTAPSAQFGQLLTQALGGNAEAMRALPQAATAAVEAAKATAMSSAEFRLAQARVMVGVTSAAQAAERAASVSITDPVRQLATMPTPPAVQDPVAKALTDLKSAIDLMSINVSEAIRVDLVNQLGVIDDNLSGGVDWAEFSNKFSGLASEATLRTVFNALDSDRSGVITRLEAVVGNTAQIAKNIGAAVGDVISSTPSASGMSYSSFFTALQTEAGKQGVDKSLVTQGFATGLFNQLDVNASGRLEANEANSSTITSAMSQLIKSTQTSGSGGSGSPSTPGNTFTEKDKTVMAQHTIVNDPPGDTGYENYVYNLYTKLAFRKPEKSGFDYWVNTTKSYANKYGETEAYQLIQDSLKQEVANLGYSTRAGAKDFMTKYFLGMGMSSYGASYFAGEFDKFALGGVFTNGVVDRPTSFDMGLMGEAGPEAIMPLTRAPGGALGVRAMTQPAGAELAALLSEMQALRQEVEGLRAEARSTALATNKTRRVLERVTRDGEAMQTVAA